jgi:hypothetical protein
VTVQVISVGRSILNALAEPYRTFTERPELASAIARVKPDQLLAAAGVTGHDRDGASSWLSGALAPSGTPGRPQQADKLAEATRAIRPDLWPGDFSAELQTFRSLPGARYPLPTADIALLVCSDTPDGLLAGAWNAAALAGGDLSRVRYLPSPGIRPGPFRGNVVVARVPGMDAANEEGFRRAMGGLGTLARGLLRSGELTDREPFHFYLSGGFKAAIPYLIGLAEGVRSLDAARPVKAFVLHETSEEGAPPIRLPLRHLIAALVQDELSGFDADGVRTSVPKPALLDGYAYEVIGKKCRLTAFGEGLRTLFGMGPEWVGG